MKRFLISLGKAVLYTLLFLGVQAASVWIVAFFGSLYALLAPYGGNPFFSDITSLATIVSCVLLYVLLFLFFAVRRKWLHHETGFCVMPAAGQVLTGTLSLGFGLCILLNFMLALLPFPAEWIEQYEEQASWLAEDSAVVLFFATVIFAPLAEELVFRGLVYTRLKRGLPQRGMGIFFAALISAVIFGALHGTLLQLFYTVPMGLLLCFVYDRYKSLWASVLVHMAFNLCSFVLSYYWIDTVYVFGVFACIGVYLTVFGFASGESYRRNRIPKQPLCSDSYDSSITINIKGRNSL